MMLNYSIRKILLLVALTMSPALMQADSIAVKGLNHRSLIPDMKFKRLEIGRAHV